VEKSPVESALDLLEEVSEELTEIVVTLEPGELRDRMTCLSQRVDDFLIGEDEAEEDDEEAQSQSEPEPTG